MANNEVIYVLINLKKNIGDKNKDFEYKPLFKFVLNS